MSRRLIHDIVKRHLNPSEKYIYGFANLTGLLPSGFEGYSFGISIAGKLDDNIIDRITDAPTPEYLHHYEEINHLTLAIAESIASDLCREGIDAVAIKPTILMKKLIPPNGTMIILFLFTTLLIFSGCSNKEVVTECLKGHTYGFWGGLWHGIIAPIDLIAMLWRDDVSVFAPNNNGVWYALGFIAGSGGWGFLGGHGASRRYRKR